MIALDTQEKIDLVLNALEDGEIFLDNRKRTKEEEAEFSRELAELKATRGKSPASEKEWEEFSRELAEVKAMRQETSAAEAIVA
jgi:hypothetical protein